MQPFDVWALVAMLSAFYPAVTRANLEKAYRDRREYFGGGKLIGKDLDVLVIPDGRAWDIVYAAWLPVSRWQALELTGQSGAPKDDVYPLEEGPIAPLDPGIWPETEDGQPFEGLAGELLFELGIVDGAIGLSYETIAAAASPAAFEAAAESLLGDAAQSIEDSRYALDALRPEELMDASDGQAYAVDAAERGYPDPNDEPDDLPIDKLGPPPDDFVGPGGTPPLPV